MAEKIHATQDWVKTEIANLTDSAPETLDTLKELAEALGNDENFATTITEELGKKAKQTDVEANEKRIQQIDDDLMDLKYEVEDTGYLAYGAMIGVENLKKYGEIEVYKLEKDYDFVTDESGTVIIGTTDEKVLDRSGYTIAIPEGITKISIYDDSSKKYIIADKIILPSTFKEIESNAIAINEVVLGEGITSFSTVDFGFSGNLFLPKSLISLDLFEFNGNIYCDRLSNEFNFNLNGGTCCLYGYAGSIAEKIAKEYGLTFVNIGSDYSIPINNSTETVATIKPNEYYTFCGVFDETGNEVTPLSSLTVTLDTASTTRLDEFMFSFVTPSDISGFSFGVLTDESVEIKWIKEPNLKPDYVYEVSVVNSVGVIAGTAKEVA